MSLAPATCGLQFHLPCRDSLDCWQFFEGTSDRSIYCLNFPPVIQLPGLLLDSSARIIHGVICAQVTVKNMRIVLETQPPIQAPQSEHIFAGTLLEAWARDPAHSGWFIAVPGFRTSDHHSLCARASIHLPSQLRRVEIYTVFSWLQF